MAPFLRFALLVTALTFTFFAAHALADDDEAGPAMGHSLDPDDLTVESEDPDDMMGDSKDPDDLVVESEDLEDHAGRSYELGDLPQDSGSQNLPDPMPQLVAEPSPPGPNDGSQVHAAWRAVQSAERNMEASNDIYANMIDNNYPRGERRARIIEERRAAFDEVNQARLRYSKLRGE